MSLTPQSERMILDAIEQALAHPGMKVLVLRGNVNLKIESEKAEKQSDVERPIMDDPDIVRESRKTETFKFQRNPWCGHHE
jgi:hypothetical protein